MKKTLLVSVSLLIGCAEEMPHRAREISLGPPAGPVTLIREASDHDRGGYDLFRPLRPIPVNGAVWVLDGGNDQLVRFDSTLSHAEGFSREGEGPGELQFATDLMLEGARLVVSETGN